jgi:hypothetical protein
VPFGPPAHPAYPSAHATQSHLIGALLCMVDSSVRSRFADELDWLAKRIAMNRERAGVHYESDSIAGEALAKYVASHVLAPCLAVVTALLGAGFTAPLTEAQKGQVLATDQDAMPELWNLLANARTEWLD